MATLITGTRILPAAPVAPDSILQALAGIVTPHLSDNLARREGIAGLHRYNRAGKLVGTALTVKTRPGDNLMIYKAMMQVQPGHVLVVDAGGDLSNAVLGEIMKRYLQAHGCAGVVVDLSLIHIWIQPAERHRRVTAGEVDTIEQGCQRSPVDRHLDHFRRRP